MHVGKTILFYASSRFLKQNFYMEKDDDSNESSKGRDEEEKTNWQRDIKAENS